MSARDFMTLGELRLLTKHMPDNLLLAIREEADPCFAVNALVPDVVPDLHNDRMYLAFDTGLTTVELDDAEDEDLKDDNEP